MRNLLFVLLLVSIFPVFSQETQAEIDQQIWVPFTKAWESNDHKAYNALHTDDVWRITPGRLLVGDAYKKRNVERMTSNISQGQKRRIEFWFEHRMANNDKAYEIGYYRITDTSADEPKYYYGRFHIALKKIDGRWKISQDWDSSNINGNEVTAEEYAKGNSKHYE